MSVSAIRTKDIRDRWNENIAPWMRIWHNTLHGKKNVYGYSRALSTMPMTYFTYEAMKIISVSSLARLAKA